jgi:hypothetical protein
MGYLKIGKYYGPNPDETLIYEFKETLDEYYLNISCVAYWFQIGEEAGKDYLYQRTGSLGYIANSQSFSELTDNDKVFAAQNFCVDKADRDTIYTDAEQESYWSIYIAKSQEARQIRWNKAKSYISYRLTRDESNEIANETLILNEKYVDYGIESKALDNIDGLFDYVQGTAAYTDSGFPSKTYYTPELEAGIMNYLDGTYNTTP